MSISGMIGEASDVLKSLSNDGIVSVLPSELSTSNEAPIAYEPVRPTAAVVSPARVGA